MFPGVDWIKFIYKLIWERGERRSKFGLNGHGTKVELRALGQGHKKISEVKDSPFEDRPLLGQGHRCKCSPENNNSKVFNFFFQVISKKKKIKKSPKKNKFFYKKRSTKFKDSINTAVLEPKTGQFSWT